MAEKRLDIRVGVTGNAPDQLAKLTQAVEGLGDSLSGLKKLAIEAFAAFELGKVIADSLKAFGEEERTIKKLSDSLDLIGKRSADSMKSFEAFASSIESVTTYADDAVLKTMALGASMGKLAGEDLKSATIAAIGLSEAFDKDLDTTMRLVIKASEGNFAAFKKLGITFSETATSQEKFNIVMQRGIEAFALARGQAETYEGVTKSLHNAINNLQERIGAALAPAFASLWRSAQPIIPVLQRIADDIGHGISSAMDRLMPVLKTFGTYTVTAFAAISFSIENWRRVFSLAIQEVKVKLFELVDVLRYVFVDAMPRMITAALEQIGRLPAGIGKAINQILNPGGGASANASGVQLNTAATGGAVSGGINPRTAARAVDAATLGIALGTGSLIGAALELPFGIGAGTEHDAANSRALAQDAQLAKQQSQTSAPASSGGGWMSRLRGGISSAMQSLSGAASAIGAAAPPFQFSQRTIQEQHTAANMALPVANDFKVFLDNIMKSMNMPFDAAPFAVRGGDEEKKKKGGRAAQVGVQGIDATFMPYAPGQLVGPSQQSVQKKVQEEQLAVAKQTANLLREQNRTLKLQLKKLEELGG